jgi:cytochrome b
VKNILVWDLPTRLFHWLFAAGFTVAWLTAGEDRWLSVHSFTGYVVLGLVVFRLGWGLAGGHYARFASFAYRPMAGLAYVRALLARQAPPYIGHNPAGSQAIYLLLALGLLVCLTGVFTQGGEEGHGAATGAATIATGTWLKQAHDLSATAMLIVVFGHLAGVALDSWLTRENLPRSMVTGIKEAADGSPASRPYRAVAGVMMTAIGAFGFWWFYYALHAPVERALGRPDAPPTVPHVAFVGPKLPDDPMWREECGSCHLAFHPNLLPARSWTRLMQSQVSHFGANLALEPATANAVLAFLQRNAAENSTTEPAFKINSSIAANATPVRITETPYWVEKHKEISAADWQLPRVKTKANCAACHLDAEAGTFEDAAMRIPRN